MSNPRYPEEFKIEAVRQVTERGLPVAEVALRIPANVTGHSGDRDRFAHGLHAGTGFVL